MSGSGPFTTGHDHVDMRVMGHGRAPGVEHRGHADADTEMAGISGDGHQRFRRRFEQEDIDHRLVGVSDVGDRSRQGEDDVVVGHRQEIGGASLQPVARRHALALGTMPVAAGIVCYVAMTAGHARRHMPAERGGSAGLDRRHHLQLGQADMAGIRAAPCGTVVAEDVRDLESRAPSFPGHRRQASARPLRQALHGLERARHVADGPGGDMGVERGGLKPGMAQ